MVIAPMARQVARALLSVLAVSVCVWAGIVRAASTAAEDPPGQSLTAPEAGAPPRLTHAQQELQELVAGGETDINELVKVIVSDTREALDHVVINLPTQTLYECNADGQVLGETKVSTGRRGFETPPGEYHVVNRSPKAYSQKYEAWMLHWMGLTADGSVGMHGLEGSSYERLLGHVASHGCIRMSREYSKGLYLRVKIGMPVLIVDDPHLSLAKYEPVSKQAAVRMVLELLSPSDPSQVFY
jgi:lipoprotein-anchoring transpeptidase ErfK/SrfK